MLTWVQFISLYVQRVPKPYPEIFDGQIKISFAHIASAVFGIHFFIGFSHVSCAAIFVEQVNAIIINKRRCLLTFFHNKIYYIRERDEL